VVFFSLEQDFKMNKIYLILLLCISSFAFTQSVNDDSQIHSHGPNKDVAGFQNTEKIEIYRVRIVNDVNGEISASEDCGKSWKLLGHVIKYTEKVSENSYTASRWSRLSSVAATAVNAIHIKTGVRPTDGSGIIFSIEPAEMMQDSNKKAQKSVSFLSEYAAIFTDIKSSTGIFGGHFSPILGSPVYLETNNDIVRISPDYIPKKSDVLVIRSLQPIDYPRSFTFDNRFGGLIRVNWDDKSKIIGQVLKPVAGIGRFNGSQYADAGRLRANHNGVICISLARHGNIAGFQIIPREHSMSPEMVRTRTMTQWMVIGPLNALDPSWEGVAPLFNDYLRPSWSRDDFEQTDFDKLLTDRISVEVKINNGLWQMPPEFILSPNLDLALPAYAMTALKDITAIKINLPFMRLPAAGAKPEKNGE
jgi:hypothetical protein